jgi:hypothetical protein
MPRTYFSHVAYCTILKCSNSHHQSFPQEILAVRGGAMYINLILDVPSFTTSRLPRNPSSQRWNYVGEKWPMNFAWNARLPHSIQGSFTCRKSTTWDRWLYFPSEGRRAEDFFALKNPTASAGFEPANLGTKGQIIHLCLQIFKQTCIIPHASTITFKIKYNMKSVPCLSDLNIQDWNTVNDTNIKN